MSRMPTLIRTFSFTLAALLPLAMTSVTCAATDAPTTAAATTTAAAQQQPLQELKEVLVRGKKLATEIARSEDDLYSQYNRLNKNHDYDIVCGDMQLERGSLITKRVCVPGFVADEADASARDLVPQPAYTGYYTGVGSACNQLPVMAGTDINGSVNGTHFYQANCGGIGGTGYSLDSMSYSPAFGSASLPSATVNAYAQTRIAQLVSPERRQAYADNVLEVIHSDPRLMKVATRLAGLYQEMDSVRANFAQKKAEAAAARALNPAQPNLGPRSRL